MSTNRISNIGSKIKVKAKNTTKLAKKLYAKKYIKIALIIVLIGAVGYGIFWAGERHGAEQQKKQDAQNRLPFSADNPNGSRRAPGETRFNVIGTVTKVSESSIEVKSQNGTTSTILMDKNTTITDKKGAKQAIEAVKKDQRVIVSGTTKKDKTQIAERIRIQS